MLGEHCRSMSEPSAIPDLDQAPHSETLRRTLYDAIVRMERPEHPEPEESLPAFDPDAVRLTVFYVLGRWFAVWQDPDFDEAGRLPGGGRWCASTPIHRDRKGSCSMRSRRLTVEQEGFLTLPADICEALRLQPVDLLAIQVSSFPAFSFSVEIYRELLAADWDCVAPNARWGFVARFLSRPLTAVEGGGRVWVPLEVFPLAAGEEVDLTVICDGGFHLLQVLTHLPGRGVL